MGLQINYNVKESPDSTEVWIEDTTGVYHATNNPTGWGGVNPKVSDVTSCTVEVTRPDPTTLQVSSDVSMVFSVAGSPLPNVTGSKLVIPQTSLGLDTGDILIDGHYQIKVTVSGTFNAVAFSQSFTVIKTFSGQLRCCSEKATSDVNPCGDCAECRGRQWEVALIALAVDGVIANDNCSKPNRALEILKTATGLCNHDGCSGCS